MSSIREQRQPGDRDSTPPGCPACGRPLERLGSEETGRGALDIHPVHAYVCPSGCRSQTSDGTFEFVACPVCDSHDTTRGSQVNGCEEVACNACGTVVTVQLHTGL